MYRLCVEIASNYIKKYARKRGLNLDIPELSHDSALYAIEQYLKKPGFRIKSISAYMYLGCIKNLFKNKDRDQREVFNDEALLNAESAYTVEAGLDEGGRAPVKGFPIGAARPGQRAAPQGDRHESVILKQGLLFEELETGRDYEEIFM
jgi:hypothetical protein